jgi:chemotaxis protein MotA
MSPKKVLGDLMRGLIQITKGTPYGKQTYAELVKLVFALSKLLRRDGFLALESNIANPHESELFNQFPKISKNHHIMQFLCNALALIVDGNSEADKLRAALEEEIQVIEREHHAAVAVLSKTADALPGFGIVAAVLGIVVTMGAIDGPVEEIGHKVGAALVGTFLGILLSYGFFAPMAGRMECLGQDETVFFRTISTAVIAMAEGASPRDVVTTACRGVGTDCRPSQEELRKIFAGGENA